LLAIKRETPQRQASVPESRQRAHTRSWHEENCGTRDCALARAAAARPRSQTPRSQMPPSGGKGKDNAPPFSTAPAGWTRATFEARPLSGKGVGGVGGRVPRVAVSHGAMRRLRLAVGEEVLLAPADRAPAATMLGAGEAASDSGSAVQRAMLETAARTGALCSALAWPSAAVGACGVGISETTREALGLQDGALVLLCRRSAVDPPCSSSSAPRLPYASRLILSPPAGHEWQHGAGDLGRTSRAATAVLLSQLVGRVVCGGMRVPATLHGRPLVLVVKQVDPLGAGERGDTGLHLGGLAVVTSETAITLARAAGPQSEARHGAAAPVPGSYAGGEIGEGDGGQGGGAEQEHERGGARELGQVLAEVGGCHVAAQALVDALRGGLQLAHEYEAMGLQPPRGVLLFGPPGTGKTLLARTAAKALGALLLCVDAPELVGGVYGDSEHRIAELFASARAAHAAVLFIDEIGKCVVCGVGTV